MLELLLFLMQIVNSYLICKMIEISMKTEIESAIGLIMVVKACNHSICDAEARRLQV
jgi:hypothetical protein